MPAVMIDGVRYVPEGGVPDPMAFWIVIHPEEHRFVGAYNQKQDLTHLPEYRQIKTWSDDQGNWHATPVR